DILIRITATNRGPEPAELHLLPTLWYRNTWSWDAAGPERPTLRSSTPGTGHATIETDHPSLGPRWLYGEGTPEVLFTENDTNAERLWGVVPNPSPYVKDGINRDGVEGKQEAVDPAAVGTKAALYHRMTLGPGESLTTRLRPSNAPLPGAPCGNAV